MPTPQELELLELLQAERRRNASGSGEPEGVALPDLSPDMLLSVAARREVEAAQTLSGRRMMPEPRQVERPMTAREFRASQEPIEMSEDMGDIDLDARDGWGTVPEVTSNDDAVLSSIFMGREAQEAAQALGGGSFAASGYDIEFDSDSMIEGRTSPNESARFQIGRQSPPRMPFSAARMQGPSDGVVVSNRGSNGGWERTAAARPTEPRNAIAAIREMARQEPPAPVPSRPAPRPNPPVSRQNIPTVYQRIMRGGIVDDD